MELSERTMGCRAPEGAADLEPNGVICGFSGVVAAGLLMFGGGDTPRLVPAAAAGGELPAGVVFPVGYRSFAALA